MANWKAVSRWGVRALSGGLVVVLVGAGIGWSWERSEEAAFRAALFDPPGEMIRVGDHDLHVVVRGAGSPGVLLIAGLGEDFRTWTEIQRRLSDSTLVVSYDRPGLGWSPARESDLTVDAAVEDVVRLLSIPELFEDAPILVGHSLGGAIAKQVAYQHPNKISGLVLLDAPPPPEATPAVMRVLGAAFYHRRAWSGAIGLMRWNYYRDHPDFSRDQQLRSGHLNSSGSLSREILREFQDMFESELAVASEGGLGALPLTVFVAPTLSPPGLGETMEAWQATKRSMARESELGTLIEMSTGHYIHRDNPDAVVTEILRMVGAVGH